MAPSPRAAPSPGAPTLTPPLPEASPLFRPFSPSPSLALPLPLRPHSGTVSSPLGVPPAHSSPPLPPHPSLALMAGKKWEGPWPPGPSCCGNPAAASSLQDPNNAVQLSETVNRKLVSTCSEVGATQRDSLKLELRLTCLKFEDIVK